MAPLARMTTTTSSSSINSSSSSSDHTTALVEWGALPASVLPKEGGSKKHTGRNARRAAQKCVEVESFVAVLVPLLRLLQERREAAATRQAARPDAYSATGQAASIRPIRVVDFGCGSGALILPLAAALRRRGVSAEFIGAQRAAVHPTAQCACSMLATLSAHRA